MGFIKKTLFILIPITLLFCLIAYGIEVIFPGQNLTYLGYTTPSGEYFPYVYDWKSYINNLDITKLLNIITNATDITAFFDKVKDFMDIWQDGYDLGDGIKTIIGILILAVDLGLYVINILFSIGTKLLAGILITVLSLMGINISYGNNAVISVLIDFINIPSIPMIPIWN